MGQSFSYIPKIYVPVISDFYLDCQDLTRRLSELDPQLPTNMIDAFFLLLCVSYCFWSFKNFICLRKSEDLLKSFGYGPSCLLDLNKFPLITTLQLMSCYQLNLVGLGYRKGVKLINLSSILGISHNPRACQE